MVEIRPWLYVGSYRESMDEHLLALYQIDAVLQLAAPRPSPGCETLVLHVEDGEPLAAETLRRGVQFAAAALRAERRCLIACGAGISRSVVFATAALWELERLPLLTAAAEVKRAHADAVFHPVLWDSLVSYTGEDVSFRDVLLLGL